MRGKGNAIRLKRPLLWGGVAAATLTAVAFWWPWWAAVAVAALFVSWFLWRRSAVCALLAVAFLLISVGYRHWYIESTRHLDGYVDTITGVVVEEPGNGKMYTVRVETSSVLRENTRVSLLYYGEENPTLYAAITAKVRLYATENDTYSMGHGCFVRAFPVEYIESDMQVTGTTETAVDRWMHRVRLSLQMVSVPVLGRTESAVLSAVCFGECAYLDAATVEAFRVSGLSHLLVVSGLHVSVVALALRRLFRRFGRHAACLLSLCGVWWFGWLVGFSPSVLRAATMCSVWLIGRWLFCRADGLNTLGFAAVVVLAWEPYALWDGGFQLSFAATFGVLLLAPRLTPRFEKKYNLPWWQNLWQVLRRTVVSGAAVCLSALLFTLPIAVHHYGGFSLTTVVSNVLAVAPVGVMMALGWLGTLCGLVPFLGWLSNGLLLPAGLLARYVRWVAAVCSPDWAWIPVTKWWQEWLILGLCAAIVCGILCRIPWHRVLVCTAFLAVTVYCVATPLTTPLTEMTVVSIDGDAAIVIRYGDDTALLLTHGREVDEAAYALPNLDPDAVFVAEAAASDALRLERYPDATRFVAEGVCLSGTLCPVGGTVTLWEGCTLTLLSEDWWLVRVGVHRVRICVDPKAPAADTTDFCIYVGGTPTHPPTNAYAVACTEAWLRRYRPTLTGREICVVHTPTTFVLQEGEWRVSPWL